MYLAFGFSYLMIPPKSEEQRVPSGINKHLHAHQAHRHKFRPKRMRRCPAQRIDPWVIFSSFESWSIIRQLLVLSSTKNGTLKSYRIFFYFFGWFWFVSVNFGNFWLIQIDFGFIYHPTLTNHVKWNKVIWTQSSKYYISR